MQPEHWQQVKEIYEDGIKRAMQHLKHLHLNGIHGIMLICKNAG